MNNFFIKNVIIINQKKIIHPLGNIIKIISKNDRAYEGFSEAYFSEIKKNAIKAWKYHKKMSLNLFVTQGKVKFVFFDGKNSFYKIKLSEYDCKQVFVKPKVWFGFKGLGKKNKILNFSNIVHKKSELNRKRKEDILFKW